MTIHLDHYLAPQSPWTYLGHDRFVAMARDAGASISVRPVELGQVFAVSGGVQLKDRPKQRQAYRLMELSRFRQALNKPLNIHPAYFPVDATAASKLIIAVDQQHGTQTALDLAGRTMAAVWSHEQNIADRQTLGLLLEQVGVPATLLDAIDSEKVASTYDHNTRDAIDAGVFGAPTYVIDGELFWGQDRLDFVEKALRHQS
jgi:2-hydroxychromene-2-carboxylate isomerase